MTQVFKRADRRYIRYRSSSGKDVRKRVPAKTKREAEFFLAKELNAVENGTLEFGQTRREVVFFEICEDFLTYGQAHKRSWERDAEHIRKLKAYFGNVPAIEIKPAKVEEFVAYRKRSKTSTGSFLAPATINRELACLRTIYNRAIRNEKLEKNPVRYVRFLKENNKRNRVLSKEEFDRLLSNSADHLKVIMITAHETGMRSGEIFGLDWSQVHMDKGFIVLFPEQTKTNEGRKIPISALLCETLERIRKKSGPVFRYDGHSIGSVKNAFKKACKRARIEDFRFHDFRHTFVTNMRRAGKQDRVIMAITGHKTMLMLTRYDTVDEDDLRKAVA